MIDTIEGLTAYLRSVSALMTEVSSRIYGPPGLPPEYRGQKAVLILPEGGESRLTVPLENDTVQIRCYGPEPKDGKAVFKVLYDALHRVGPVSVAVTGGNIVLARAWKTGGPRYQKEPELGWHFWVTMWRLIWTDRVLP